MEQLPHQLPQAGTRGEAEGKDRLRYLLRRNLTACAMLQLHLKQTKRR